jgi:hypothetical protein
MTTTTFARENALQQIATMLKEETARRNIPAGELAVATPMILRDIRRNILRGKKTEEVMTQLMVIGELLHGFDQGWISFEVAHWK